ncbi:ester cyclase [Bordetella muralis]|jgi:hypothetical protein|uniref:ester cyclase n=1 Tax=Bordetella muralis TaxID=1649130 RepID=UPI0039EF7E32
MTVRKPTEIVNEFWQKVWSEKNPAAADHLVAEDFHITSGGVVIGPREEFKAWVRQFLDSINDFKFEVLEIFQNEEGNRVVTRWVVTGKNNGLMGFEPCQSPIHMTGTAIIHVRDDGLLQHNWVERNALEVHRNLASNKT